ncbi:hypothetical protein RHO13_03935 [Orbus wheelerorum]|uniref:hypothetical protein n=1 Tax=Orbus wheelerorum TaxID=3074111 RepID=UPI00370D9F91
MKYYLLITTRQWQELQKPIDDNSLFPHRSIVPRSIVDYTKLKPVRYRYSSEMDDVVKHCVKNQDQCKNLYPTLEKLGLYYGTNTYNKDDIKFSQALKDALTSQRAILIDMPVDPCSGMMAPENNFLKLPSNKIARRLTPEEVKACELARYGNEDNWIEITVKDLPNQPFTLFNNGSREIVKQGTLDSNGYAYVDLPVNAQYVDIVFDKKQEYRPWYYDVPLQIWGGIVDAGQSVTDLLWDISPFSQAIKVDFNDGQFSSAKFEKAAEGESPPNPIQFGKVPEAETVAGALAHGVSQFLVGFLPTSRALKIIKPLKKMGTLTRGMIAGGVADFAVFAPHEERLSNLVESFDELKNPVTEYLKASPDDSAAEGRLKNALEGAMIGALIEPFSHSLRALKYARIKRMVPEVKTKVHYKLEASEIENKNLSIKDFKQPTYFKGTLKGQEYIFKDIELRKIEYIKRSPEELISLRNNFNQGVRQKFLKNLSENDNLLKEIGFNDIDIQKIKNGRVPDGWQIHHNLPLDDSGTNDFNNLVLIRNDPYHKVITNYQNSVSKGMISGDKIEVDWPIIRSSVYPLTN